MQLEIERQALKKEDDANSKERLAGSRERELAEIREQANALKAQWKQEKEADHPNARRSKRRSSS